MSAWVGTTVHAQTFVNPGFENGTTGWSSCPLEINPESVYGGVGSNRVAEVDGDNDPSSTADDRQLCQTVSGFTIGSIYALEFDAARRQGGPTPAIVSVTVRIDNTLEAVVTRSGGWSLDREVLFFTATSTTHSLHITPNFTVSYGMLFDNFAYTLVSALPVELLHFEARSEDGSVALEWSTASEQNSAYFNVERSTDLTDWTTVATHAAAGTSQQLIHYDALDQEPLTGLSYYRLEQVDIDGSVAHSPIRSLYHTGPTTSSLVLWPNPAQDRISIQVADNEGASIRVLNSLGQQVQLPMDRNGTEIILDLSQLPRGQYLVLAQGTKSTSGRFVKL
ncbi:MAG: T9SS type A sorting domain-containing protein [Flavobacteriales bacterium]|nr:T9SS type A sorting domain-containing protein [Flavobacteriales bacterium]